MAKDKLETMIIRIDEQVRFIADTIKEIPDKYVSKDSFSPVRNIVYGFISLILIAVIGSLITLVVK